MNKQEIIDNLRLEISHKDLMIIDLTLKNKDLLEYIKKLESRERLAEAIGGEIDIKFIPMKSELELLREENEWLRKQLSAKRYVENGTLNKRS